MTVKNRPQVKEGRQGMKDKAMAMVMASFAADSLALGAHWIYSTDKIARDFGRIETFLAPYPDSYHATKKKGEFTHYGDQAFVLLESLAARGGFDPGNFSSLWQQLFAGYKGYYDQATKATLENLSLDKTFLEAGSSSNDLSGAARIAPLVYCLDQDEEDLVLAARTQTDMTHRDSLSVDASGFFARVAYRVLHGMSPVSAIEEVSSAFFKGSRLQLWADNGIESCSGESVQAIKTFGQDCHTPNAFPSVIHLICRYENDLKEALVQNVMAGGDSAARGMTVGMILGAHLGMEAIPVEWRKGLKKGTEIERLLKKIHP
jgi:ADP-ribosylglycohydrolase